MDEVHRQALLAVATNVPPASPSSSVTETERRQQHLHEMLSSIQQATQHMDWLASQHQPLPQVIDPALLAASVSAVHYGGRTIDGPQVTPAGQRCFYLEQQCGHACAQHAVNAMVGGPLVSLSDFARHEAQAPQQTMPASRQGIAADMLARGVQVETVKGTLHEQGMPMHCYAHVPIAHAQGLDPVQARFLDGLRTDRLLLQADRYEGDSASSHYVAFRRDGGQWVLLDSLHHVPQYRVAPSAYLLADEKIRHFTALWPQHALRGQDALVAVGGMEHDRQEASGRRAREEQQMQQTAEPPVGRPARCRKTAPARQQAGAPSTTRSPLVAYAEERAATEMQDLLQVTSTPESQIAAKLSAQCLRKNGRKDDPELAACKKFLLTAGMNMLVGLGVAQEEIIGVLETATPAQQLVEKMPEKFARLRTSITPQDWNTIARKNPGGYAFLALLILEKELDVHPLADLVRCAKKGNHGKELIALTQDEYIEWIPESKDRISIAANGGGWKNLEAAKDYLEQLFQQREQARQSVTDNAQARGMAMTPDQIEREVEQLIAPFAIPMKDMVSILSHGGGSKNLEAAKDYLAQLFQQRVQLEQQGYSQQQVEQAMAPFVIPMKDMVRILSHDGGSKNLEAAKDYLAQVFQQRVQLEQQGYSQQQVEQAMAPFTITREELVSTVARTGGANRLKELLDSMK